MIEFIKGLELCENFFREEIAPIIKNNFLNLCFSAGLLGYGSDVLGYDDIVSTDHMWGPRVYIFLNEDDIRLKKKLMECFANNLPYKYKGYSVNFSEPVLDDNGVRHPEFIDEGKVSPLIWIYTIQEYIKEYLGIFPKTNFDWLSLSEHRLLGFTSGKLFTDMLEVSSIRKELSFYPNDVKLYLLASQWSMIAEEQAFVKRCSDCGDELGSRIVCTRILERLMRLCFLYSNKYAPYSKWLGTAFDRLQINPKIKEEIHLAIGARDITQRETHLVKAQVLVAELHNELKVADTYSIIVENYYGRNIKVIFAEKIAEGIREKITDDELKRIPLFGSLSQVGNFVAVSDDPQKISTIKELYRKLKN